ncbi:zinc finger protein 92 homolog [Natator depressus]|uniref:zinc finger protein 92 homolog n=1 Tax=Natator depressus TaxID=27790 RepID=UPI003EB98ADA
MSGAGTGLPPYRLLPPGDQVPRAPPAAGLGTQASGRWAGRSLCWGLPRLLELAAQARARAGSGREAAPGREAPAPRQEVAAQAEEAAGAEPSPAMAAAGPAQLRVAFEDVALYFSREEWELLSRPEKQLYRDQMLRNYRALVSLGYSGSTPDLIHQIEVGEAELWIRDAEDSRESSGPESPFRGLGILGGTRTQSECGESTVGKQDSTSHRGIHAQDAVHPRGKLSQRPDLATHQRLPMGQRPHHCIDCAKRFSNPSALNQHQCTHTREWLHRCSDCGKDFAQSSTLRTHQRTHRGAAEPLL